MDNILPLFREIGSDAFKLIREIEDGDVEVGENPLGQHTIKADRELEDLVIHKLKDANVGGKLITEELGEVDLDEGDTTFVCDPLDGSNNFRLDVPVYCMGLAAASGDTYRDVATSYIINLITGDEYWATDSSAFKNGSPITTSTETILANCILEFDPIGQPSSFDLMANLLPKVADIRRYAANLLGLVFLAQGSHHVFIDIRDSLSAVHVSGVHIAEKAGAILTHADGTPFDCKLEVAESMSFVASCNQTVHEKVLDSLR